VDLEWTQSFDNIGVDSYRVLRDGATIATMTADPNPFVDETYRDVSVSPNASYTYRVVALDAAGNLSDPSGPASVTTPIDPDTQAPTPPDSVQASAALPTEVDLTWSASTDDRLLAGYRVVRDGQLIAELTDNATSYADVGTDPSTRYTYEVQAVDAAGNVSAATSVSVTTPALPCNAAGGSLPPTTSQTYRAFPPGSIWNTQIRSAATDCNSDAMMTWLRADSGSDYIRLAGSTTDGTWGNPIYWSTEDDPAYALTNTCTVAMPPEFQAIRIPLSAQPDDSADAAMTVYDLASGIVAAFHHTVRTVASDGSVSWSTCGGAAYHVDSNGLEGRAAGANDARNVGHRGVPPSTYAVRWDEIDAGSIDHALKIAINNTCDHVWPLVGDEGCNGGGLIPEGTRIRIRPEVDLSTYGLSRAQLTIVTALQRYGAFVGDQSGGGVALKVENTVAEGRGDLWNGVLDPRSLSKIPLSAYEVVERGWGQP
ncbi:MAG TPA: hypothetical protein VJ736_07450, partial [Actinomycetota bacterium]|nr:hypothetical protein [Actinomycetota bacterium]